MVNGIHYECKDVWQQQGVISVVCTSLITTHAKLEKVLSITSREFIIL